MKHTPEPWFVEFENHVYTADLQVFVALTWGSSKLDEPTIRANAHRIVACVNACEGIEDPAELRRQRDEAVTLMKDFTDEFGWMDSPEGWPEMCCRINAFISKAKEGGTP